MSACALENIATRIIVSRCARSVACTENANSIYKMWFCSNVTPTRIMIDFIEMQAWTKKLHRSRMTNRTWILLTKCCCFGCCCCCCWCSPSCLTERFRFSSVEWMNGFFRCLLFYARCWKLSFDCCWSLERTNAFGLTAFLRLIKCMMLLKVNLFNRVTKRLQAMMTIRRRSIAVYRLL